MGMSNQTEEKELFHAVSLSGGKDSTAMLLLMIERGLRCAGGPAGTDGQRYHRTPDG